MYQSQAYNHHHHIGWIDVEVFAETVNIGKRDVAHTQPDHGIDKEVIELDRVKCGVNQRDTVTDRKSSHVFGNITKTG